MAPAVMKRKSSFRNKGGFRPPFLLLCRRKRHPVPENVQLTKKVCSIKSYVMKVLVRLKQYDLLENQMTVIAETRGLLRQNSLSYFEKGGQRHDITFSEEGVVLKRSGEFGSETVLPSAGRGESRISSPYGMMRLETQLVRREKKAGYWMVEYEIIGAGGPVSHMKLVWELTMQA